MTNYRIFFFLGGVTRYDDFQAQTNDDAREEAKKYAREENIAIEILMNLDEMQDLDLRFDPSKEVSNG